MTFRTLILVLLPTCMFGQQPDTTATTPATAPAPNPFVTLASEFFEHDFVNLYAYADGVVDTNNPVLTNNGTVRNSLGTGFDVGGGVNASHAWRDAQLVLSYQGAYRDYQSSFYNSGTTQLLALSYSKRLSRRWTMNLSGSGGIFLYGGTFFVPTPPIEAAVVTNPFSPETRFAGAGITLGYQQTRRLSYTFAGSFYLQRYNYAGAVGATGVAGTGAVNYRFTARTTLSGVYTHSYFNYQRGAGNASADQVGLSLSHAFNNHWNASVFGGVARSDATGTVEVPVTFLVGTQAVGGFVIGRYSQTAWVPTYSGTVSHATRRSLFTVSAGEGIYGSGNGYFLASRSIYANGIFSYSWHNQNLSMGGTVYRLSSVANTVSSTYTGAGFSASYGHNLIRYVGMFLRYDYTRYGALLPYGAIYDNRFTFGVSFSSRSVPLTLF